MLLNLLLVALLVLVIAVIVALARLHQRVEELHARLGAVTLPPPTDSKGPVIGIEILNPFELAEREHVLAGHAARFAPKMIERIVYQRAAGQIAEQLKAQGVDAQVRAHVA